jgi:hypothetical protein
MCGIWLVLIRVKRVAVRNMVAAVTNWNNEPRVPYPMSHTWMIGHKATSDFLAVVAHAVVGYD